MAEIAAVKGQVVQIQDGVSAGTDEIEISGNVNGMSRAMDRYRNPRVAGSNGEKTRLAAISRQGIGHVSEDGPSRGQAAGG